MIDLDALRANAAANARERGRPTRFGLLVCVCVVPAADPRVNFGMCPRCARKPLALMKARPVALAVAS